MHLSSRRHKDDWYRVTKFHHVIDEDFNVIGAGSLKFHLRKNRYIVGVKRGILQRKLHFRFSQ